MLFNRLESRGSETAASISKSSSSMQAQATLSASPKPHTTQRPTDYNGEISGLKFVREDGRINKYTLKRPHTLPRGKSDERAKRPEVPGVPKEYTSVLDQIPMGHRAHPMDPLSKVVKASLRSGVNRAGRARAGPSMYNEGSKRIAGGDVEAQEQFIPPRVSSGVAEWHVPQPGTTEQLETIAHLDQGSPASPHFDSLQQSREGLGSAVSSTHEWNRARSGQMAIPFDTPVYAPPPGPPPGHLRGLASSIPSVHIHPADVSNGGGYDGFNAQPMSSYQLQQQPGCQASPPGPIEVFKCRCGKMYECGTGREVQVRGQLQSLCASCPSPFTADIVSPAFSDLPGEFQYGDSFESPVDPMVITDFSFMDADRLAPVPSPVTVTSQSGSVFANGQWTPDDAVIGGDFDTQPVAGMNLFQ